MLKVLRNLMIVIKEQPRTWDIGFLNININSMKHILGDIFKYVVVSQKHTGY